jgi:hypothetical protein
VGAARGAGEGGRVGEEAVGRANRRRSNRRREEGKLLMLLRVGREGRPPPLRHIPVVLAAGLLVEALQSVMARSQQQQQLLRSRG